MKNTLMKDLFRAALLAALSFGAGCATSGPDSETPGGGTGPGPDSGTGTTVADDRELKEWMFDYMLDRYLWNDAAARVTPDYTLGYEAFLTKILEDIAAQEDVNHDDGHWVDGVRQYFYSNIVRYETDASDARATRGVRETSDDAGFAYLYYMYRDQTRTDCLLLVGGVSPFSPAGKAGLRRGDYIEKVDGESFDASQIDAVYNRVVNPEGEVTLSLLANGDQPAREITYRRESYEDNPVWKVSTLTTPGGRQVGYLCYNSFNYYYDDELLEAFSTLREADVEDLVLDLRYNGGGHVVSSLLIGTAVAGEAHRDEVYMRSVINASREASGESGDVYRIGAADFGSGRYDKTVSALDVSLGLPRVYVLCKEQTASASELVINGLRGLGIDVRLVGSVTNGKNVGMEIDSRIFDGYEYDFSPITFYSENAQGFHDYGDGFTPDVEASEGSLAIADWGDPDDGLLALALAWIDTGQKPSVDTRAVRAGAERMALPAPERPLQGMIAQRDFPQP